MIVDRKKGAAKIYYGVIKRQMCQYQWSRKKPGPNEPEGVHPPYLRWKQDLCREDIWSVLSAWRLFRLQGAQLLKDLQVSKDGTLSCPGIAVESPDQLFIR